ncbi:MAG: efflux RND transporter permease subunit [Candidatus Dadabacteria bacterium]|nr:MAG: efflux RND transporter permease subunit [Candidatus Dadabacteria bacterium]
MPGTMGQIFSVISYTVIFALSFSLLESLLILPVHLRHNFLENIREPRKLAAPFKKFKNSFNEKFDLFVEKLFAPFLRKALLNKYITVSTAVGLLLISVFSLFTGIVQFRFFPYVEADYVIAAVVFPDGTAAAVTKKAVKELERAAKRVDEKLKKEYGKSMFNHIASSIGTQPLSRLRSTRIGIREAQVSEPHVGEVAIELVPAENREISALEVQRLWQKETPEIEGVEELSFFSSLFSVGSDITIQLAGENFQELSQAIKSIKSKLKSYPGVYNISDTYKGGKEEYIFKPLAKAHLLGVTASDIAQTLRSSLYGAEALKLQRGSDEVKVMVRRAKEERKYESLFEKIYLTTKEGKKIPLSEVADYKRTKSFSYISRDDKERTVSVSADVDDTKASVEGIKAKIKKEIFPLIKEQFPDVSLSFQGAQKEQREAVGGIKSGLAASLVLIYALIAVPFKSYFQPLIIMFAIPFGIIGAIWGHFFLGLQVSIMSLFGLVALAGVVVNDGILLVNFINRNREEENLPLEDAIIKATLDRFRAVVLTSVTTFVGLLPIIFERSTQAQFLIPIAVSLSFGVAFATVITLIIVPCMYLILDNFLSWVKIKVFHQKIASAS